MTLTYMICLCSSGNKLWRHLYAIVKDSRRTHNVTADATVEVQRYLSEPNMGRTQDPLLVEAEVHLSKLVQSCHGILVRPSFISTLLKSFLLSRRRHFQKEESSESQHC